ncbi:MAG: Uncharacterised protein [SAR116 cluster bacterium]|nr:MAG: Uncharacterised protein [SAR116 cluster bacterium]
MVCKRSRFGTALLRIAIPIGLFGSTTRNDSTIRQYDYKRSDVSLTVNYRLTD